MVSGTGNPALLPPSFECGDTPQKTRDPETLLRYHSNRMFSVPNSDIRDMSQAKQRHRDLLRSFTDRVLRDRQLSSIEE